MQNESTLARPKKVTNANSLLYMGGIACFILAVLHIGVIIIGAEWYRLFGAGEEMAILAEQGSWIPAFVTFGITIILSLWGCYAFSGAGRIGRLPFRKAALVIIAAIFILRGLGILAPLLGYTGHSGPFMLLTSAISLSIGLLFSVGTKKAWASL